MWAVPVTTLSAPLSANIQVDLATPQKFKHNKTQPKRSSRLREKPSEVHALTVSDTRSVTHPASGSAALNTIQPGGKYVVKPSVQQELQKQKCAEPHIQRDINKQQVAASTMVPMVACGRSVFAEPSAR